MNHSRTLPFPVTVQSDVNPLGFTQQLAIANGFRDITHFARITGIRPTLLAAGNYDELALLAKWAGSDLKSLSRFLVSTRADRLNFGCAVVRRAYLQTATATTRLCPYCLADDLSASTAKAHHAFIRASWSWRQIFRCPIHGISFIKAGRIETLGQLSKLACKGAIDETAVHQPDPSDRYFYNRVFGPGGSSYLDGLEAYVATELCSVMGHLKLSVSDRRIVSEMPYGFENAHARSAGFEIVKLGESATRDALREFHYEAARRIASTRPICLTITRWLGTKTDMNDYAKVIDLFQGFAERHFPLGQGDRYIRSVTERIVHSTKTAAREYGISQTRIERVVRENHGFLPGSQNFIRGEMHEHILNEKQFITLSEAAVLLGCDIPRVDLLIRANMISVKPGETIGKAFCLLVLASSVEAFRTRFSDAVCRADESDLTNLRTIRTSDYRSAVVIDLVLSGRIKMFAAEGVPVKMNTVLVNRGELRREIQLVMRGQPALTRRRQFSLKNSSGSLSETESP